MSRIESWSQKQVATINAMNDEREWLRSGVGSNFGQSVELSEYQNAYGEGYDIRDNEVAEVVDAYGVPEELTGFGELIVEESEVADPMAELQDSAVWGESNGSYMAGPHSVELHIIPAVFNKKVESGMDVDEAYRIAAWAFRQETEKVEAKNEALERAIVKLHREDWGESDGFAIRTATRFLLGHMEETPKPVVFEQTPVTNYRETLVDEKLSACQREDAAWQDWKTLCESMENSHAAKYRCFGRRGEKLLGVEEMVEMRRTKEERDEAFQAYRAWIKRASAKALAKAFGRGGVFWRRLKASRSKCFSDGRKETASVPWKVWLTKAQVDALVAAKEEREVELVLKQALKK